MNDDPGSLENLRDIFVPPDVAAWPPAPGWWIVITVCILGVLLFGMHRWRIWQVNAYRRTARRALEKVSDPAAISEILKRTAMVAFPRSTVASLSGEAWCSWLERTGGNSMPQDVRDQIENGVFEKTDSSHLKELTLFATAWVAAHQAGSDLEESC